MSEREREREREREMHILIICSYKIEMVDAYSYSHNII